MRPYRVDPETFEAGVRERLKAAQKERVEDPLARLSPLLRCAAAFLPLQLVTGCKLPATAAKVAPAAGAYKLLSYLAFPAISLFVLLGAHGFQYCEDSKHSRGERLGTPQGTSDVRGHRPVVAPP